MDNNNYKAAYERQKIARERAEQALETRSSELYDANQALQTAFDQLKQQNVQILHQEKLASIGQLAAGVAHEINNPIGFIKSNLITLMEYSEAIIKSQNKIETLIDTLPPEKKIEFEDLFAALDLDFILNDITPLIEESVKGSHRIEEIVLGLKNFSRSEGATPEDVDVKECLINALKVLNNELKYKCDLTLDLNNVPSIKGFSGNLIQVMVNLISNAAQAIENFGMISIKSFHNENSVFFSVEDNGVGIPDDIIKSIFDPFFTTKPVGVGTGLGLAISYSIIQKHKGSITVNNELKEGTQFLVELPFNS